MRQWQIELSGTVGVLVRCVETELLTLEDGNALLQQMIERANYWAPCADLNALLADE